MSQNLSQGQCEDTGREPNFSLLRAQMLATAGQDHSSSWSFPTSVQPSRDRPPPPHPHPPEREEGIGPRICLSPSLGPGWHSAGWLLRTLPWALAEVHPPSPVPASASDIAVAQGVMRPCSLESHLSQSTCLPTQYVCVRKGGPQLEWRGASLQGAGLLLLRMGRSPPHTSGPLIDGSLGTPLS